MGKPAYINLFQGVMHPKTPYSCIFLLFWHSISLTAKKWRKETLRPAFHSHNNITVRPKACKLAIAQTIHALVTVSQILLAYSIKGGIQIKNRPPT